MRFGFAAPLPSPWGRSLSWRCQPAVVVPHLPAVEAVLRRRPEPSFTPSVLTSGTDAQNPYCNLISDTSGNLYGTTYGGGTNGTGAVFELVKGASGYTETVLYSFGISSGTDARNPSAGLISDTSGNLYGATTGGGTNNTGAVFELEKGASGYTEKVLYSFGPSGSADGRQPDAGLILDSSGDLYGTTYYGGTNNSGMVFELVNGGGSYTENVPYSFGPSGSGDAQNPAGSLIADTSGNLYSTTHTGGTNNTGAVFELAKGANGYTETVLSSFGPSGSGDGRYPEAGLILDTSGNFYSTTYAGGTNNNGMVFELVKGASGFTENVLYSFGPTGGTDGQDPAAGLISDSNGNLYGTTAYGGANGSGTVFKLVKGASGYTETVLYPLDTADGGLPSAGLLLDGSGNIYGTASSGGTNGTGTVFEVTP